MPFFTLPSLPITPNLDLLLVLVLLLYTSTFANGYNFAQKKETDFSWSQDDAEPAVGRLIYTPSGSLTVSEACGIHFLFQARYLTPELSVAL